MENTIKYGNVDVQVSEDVSLFLEEDRRREQAQDRSDRRHLAKCNILSMGENIYNGFNYDPTFSIVHSRLLAEKLYDVIAVLTKPEQKLIRLYYLEKYGMEQIGLEFGISKMAVSKRLKKLLSKMRNLMETWDFVIFLLIFKIFIKFGLQKPYNCPI